MAINYTCRWLSRDLLLALGGRRVDCLLSGALWHDGPKYTVHEQVRQVINELGCRRATRGRRAGLHNQPRRSRYQLMNVSSSVVRAGEIPTVIGNRFVNKQSQRRPVSQQFVLRTLSRSLTSDYTSVGLVNAQSIGNKCAAICDRIASDRLDLCAVLETWHDSADSTQLIACAPLGYRFVEQARPRTDAAMQTMRTNHGGICLFHRSTISAWEVPLPKCKSGLEGTRRVFACGKMHCTGRHSLPTWFRFGKQRLFW